MLYTYTKTNPLSDSINNNTSNCTSKICRYNSRELILCKKSIWIVLRKRY